MNFYQHLEDGEVTELPGGIMSDPEVRQTAP